MHAILEEYGTSCRQAAKSLQAGRIDEFTRHAELQLKLIDRYQREVTRCSCDDSSKRECSQGVGSSVHVLDHKQLDDTTHEHGLPCQCLCHHALQNAVKEARYL